MRRDELAALNAEQAVLRKLLESLPPQAKLDRFSLEKRLANLAARLTEAGPVGRTVGSARLTFSGKPVIGSYGIFAEFGLDTTRVFADAVAALAASIERPLAAMGPIPNREQNRLLITSVALGSFGFELEEFVAPGQQALTETPTSQALGQAQDILGSTTRSDEELADAVAGTDERALAFFRTFLGRLESNEAICGLEVKGKKFQFSDVSQVRNGLERIRRENVREELVEKDGILVGLLPHRRRFELETEPGTVLAGRIGADITDLEPLYPLLRSPVAVRLSAKSVGTARPRYTLLAVSGASIT